MLVFTSYCRATTDTDAPGTRHAATISRLSASGHTFSRRFARKLLSIISVVDTFHPQVTMPGSSPKSSNPRRWPPPEGYHLLDTEPHFCSFWSVSAVY